jgi:hypothetical protein
MELEGREYQLDLLVYHLRLRCYVVIELKPGEFEPKYVGKLNFYLSLVNALRDMSKPIGVSEYSLSGGMREWCPAYPWWRCLRPSLAEADRKNDKMKCRTHGTRETFDNPSTSSEPRLTFMQVAG